MYKLAKWIYKVGVAPHERRRVKLLIAQYRSEKPERPREDGSLSNSDSNSMYNKVDYEKQIAVWYEVAQPYLKKVERTNPMMNLTIKTNVGNI